MNSQHIKTSTKSDNSMESENITKSENIVKSENITKPNYYIDKFVKLTDISNYVHPTYLQNILINLGYAFKAGFASLMFVVGSIYPDTFPELGFIIVKDITNEVEFNKIYGDKYK